MSSTRGREEEGTGPGSEGRRVVYCLVPRDLAEKLHDLLRGHFAEDPGVEVIVERRGRERRGGSERRATRAGKPPPRGERRKVRGAAGRRVGERRATLSPVETPELPRRARRHADRVVFAERLEPADERAEDRDTARLVARFQTGDQAAFDALYTRYFDRVYSYMRVALRDRVEAEDATQQVFLQLFEKLPDYEQRRQPFRAWLFVVVRNLAVRQLRKQGHTVVTDPVEIDRHRERDAVEEEPLLESVNWIVDRDLLLFVERLPEPQRQVLILRYMLDLDTPEIARILGRTETDIRGLQHRAQRFLRDRLTAIGRDRPGGKPARMRRRFQQAPVLRYRRFSLDGP